MPDELQRIIPALPPEIEGTFAAYQATSQFYREVQSREANKSYCGWYDATAERHRRELIQMRGELNIMGWFRRGKP